MHSRSARKSWRVSKLRKVTNVTRLSGVPPDERPIAITSIRQPKSKKRVAMERSLLKKRVRKGDCLISIQF